MYRFASTGLMTPPCGVPDVLCIRPFEVICPASDHLVESVFSFLNAHSIASSCYFADFVLEFLDALGMDSKSPFSPVNVEAVPQVFDIVDVCHFCLLPIHLKEQFSLDEWKCVLERALCRLLTLTEDHQVICIA